jgi:hypothetical protein
MIRLSALQSMHVELTVFHKDTVVDTAVPRASSGIMSRSGLGPGNRIYPASHIVTRLQLF